jgi:hypothetical protein
VARVFSTVLTYSLNRLGVKAHLHNLQIRLAGYKTALCRIICPLQLGVKILRALLIVSFDTRDYQSLGHWFKSSRCHFLPVRIYHLGLFTRQIDTPTTNAPNSNNRLTTVIVKTRSDTRITSNFRASDHSLSSPTSSTVFTRQ